METMLTGDGFGDGDGYGYGYGYGSGDGSGYGSGYGYGYGSGDGYGYGYGSGDGDGYGYGENIGQIGEHDVSLIRSFGVVVVGCQAHTIKEWAVTWQEIAEKHDVEVSPAYVEDLLRAVSDMSGGARTK